MRRKIIAGNWKMHKSVGDTRAFLQIFSQSLGQAENAKLGAAVGPELVIFPQSALLFLAKEYTLGGRIQFGAQNTYAEEKGAFTGELSANLAQELGCRYALSGHSERRQFFGETSEVAVKRSLYADRIGLRPMLCIGESLAEREAGKTEEVLKQQLAPLFKASAKAIPSLVIAYEPVWAIGTGITATAAMAEAVHYFLRREFTSYWGANDAASLPILYGGSAKAENAGELLACDNVDGLLVGGASLEAASFLAIAKAACG